MARTQSFDRVAATRSARSVFWRIGYEGASIPELEAATGLSRSSIYNSYGSKRGLFDAAMQSYLDEVIRPRLHPLAADPVAPDAIVTYLVGLRGAIGRGIGAAHGCLLVNTAGAPTADDETVARIIADYRVELRDAIGRGIGAHAPALPQPQAARLADAVTALVVSAFALARVDAGQSTHNIDTALALIAAG